jgi:predicted amidohydrolase
MLVLSQEPWSAAQVAAAGDIVAAAAQEARRKAFGELDWLLLLMPLAEDDAPEAEFAEAMGALAAASGAYLAGAARLFPAEGGAAMTVGFLFGPGGEQLIRAGKITPDLIEGFSNTATLPPAEASFPVARLPFANVGILPGEDILFTQHARSLVFHGAELILNPCTERSDRLHESRQFSRFGRAMEGAGYVAVASPKSVKVGALAMDLPGVTAFYNWERPVTVAQGSESFVFPDFDIQALRRKRCMASVTYPAIVRANVFGEGYRRWAEEAGTLPTPSTREGWLQEAERRLALENERFGPKRDDYEMQYDVMSVQPVTFAIPPNTASPDEAMMHNVETTFEYIGGRASAPGTRIAIFPEFWIGGSGGGGAKQRMANHLEPLALKIDGPIFDRIREFATKNKVYVAFQSFEVHEKLPHRVFNSAFLLNDSGDLINVYRKIQCADVWGGFPVSVPGSVYDQYLDVFGYDGLFPVVDTPLGILANTICFDISIPEVTGGLRHYGAELYLHSTAEGHGTEGRIPWDNSRRLRAYENGCYYLSSNAGGRINPNAEIGLDSQSRGMTKMINYDGTQQGIIDGSGQATLVGHIDLSALRRFRADARFNLHLWSNPAAYAGPYTGEVGMPSNLWAGDWLDNPYVGNKALEGVINNYLEKGIYVLPENAPEKIWDRSGGIAIRSR